MTRYELTNEAFNLLYEKIGSSKREYIESLQGLKGYFYCSCISWFSRYLDNKKWYEIINETELVEKNYIDAFYDIICIETGVYIKKEIIKEIVNYLKENKGELEYYV